MAPSPDYANTQALADAIRALASHKAGRPEEALVALGRARNALERHQRYPDTGWLAFDWHNWTQVEILAREAEALIPNAPVVVGPASLAGEQAARRERKARADRTSTQAALALIRRKIGQTQEAVAELQAVLAGRIQIVAEEPENREYLADLDATREQPGRLFLAPWKAEVVPTSARRPAVWRYTFQKPADGWMRPDFDDSKWGRGPGGFGTSETDGAVTLPPSIDPARLQLLVYHDEDVEIALDDVTAASRTGFITSYKAIEILPAALERLKPGAEVILAVHCHQVWGGQGIDVGLVELQDPKLPRLVEGARELGDALAILEKLGTGAPGLTRLRHDLASAHHAIGEAAREGDHPAEADRSRAGRAFGETSGPRPTPPPSKP